MSENRRSPMALSSTSTTGGCKRKIMLMKQSSCEEEYEASKRYYHHKLLAPRWTPWMKGKLGRRFYEYCSYYQDECCGFFAWHDGEFRERANAVINDLLNDVDKLYEENKKLQRGNDNSTIYEEPVSYNIW